MKSSRLLLIFLACAGFASSPVWAQEAPEPGKNSKACIACHQNLHPGIVSDWQRSRHASTSLGQALERPVVERRISVTDVPVGIDGSVSISCYECHGLNPDRHDDSFSHYGYEISIVVSPNDCSTCHPVEVDQYRGSKKAEAIPNLTKNPVYMSLVNTIIGGKAFDGDAIHIGPTSDSAKADSCFSCHGTEVAVDGMQTVKSRFGPVEVPSLTGWPNQGVGRINPDGSKGSCTACHPRHGMSIAIARKPATCGQCHLEPDVPAYNVYKESKHGNIYTSSSDDWHFSAVPWKPGIDFTAPTCATCHNSLLVGSTGNIIVRRSHDFSSRLWVRIFGLIYSHPQPSTGSTHTIRNDDNLPLPVTFDGTPATTYLIDDEEQEFRRRTMTAVCSACHSSSWISGYISRFHATVDEADAIVETSTRMMSRIWEEGYAVKDVFFDEYYEQLWVRQWLLYANSLRYASAMMGADYAAFKNGYWNLTMGLSRLAEILKKDE